MKFYNVNDSIPCLLCGTNCGGFVVEDGTMIGCYVEPKNPADDIFLVSKLGKRQYYRKNSYDPMLSEEKLKELAKSKTAAKGSHKSDKIFTELLAKFGVVKAHKKFIEDFMKVKDVPARVWEKFASVPYSTSERKTIIKKMTERFSPEDLLSQPGFFSDNGTSAGNIDINVRAPGIIYANTDFEGLKVSLKCFNPTDSKKVFPVSAKKFGGIPYRGVPHFPTAWNNSAETLWVMNNDLEAERQCISDDLGAVTFSITSQFQVKDIIDEITARGNQFERIVFWTDEADPNLEILEAKLEEIGQFEILRKFKELENEIPF